MTDLLINHPATLAEVTAVFARYEAALMDNDVAALDALFLAAPETIRYGVGETLYGFAEIAAFRKARPGGSPQRSILRTAITTFGTDFGTTHIEFQRAGGARGATRRGRQTQSWVRTKAGWKIVSAHVSLMDQTD